MKRKTQSELTPAEVAAIRKSLASESSLAARYVTTAAVIRAIRKAK